MGMEGGEVLGSLAVESAEFSSRGRRSSAAGVEDADPAMFQRVAESHRHPASHVQRLSLSAPSSARHTAVDDVLPSISGHVVKP